MELLLAQGEDDVISEELDNVLDEAPTTFGEAVDVIGDKLGDLWTGFLQSLPILLIALVVFLIAFAIAVTIANTFRRGTEKARVDPVVGTLLYRMLRLILVFVAAMFALSVIGVSVANFVTVIAVLGFAIGLAVQGILQNFVAGMILLIRKPFRAGDQIMTGDYEGTVDDIDFRVTRLIAYDGTIVLIPNGDVFDNPLINLTREGRRRSEVRVGVDYRDDHNAARAVLEQAVAEVEGVLEDPPSDVLLVELGDSSVNFLVRFWTKPDIGSVGLTTDRVLAACKTAIDEAGMSIPWPIRTLIVDGDVGVRRTT